MTPAKRAPIGRIGYAEKLRGVLCIRQQIKSIVIQSFNDSINK